MKELWIRRDEAWVYYDAKPVCEILTLNKPIDSCVIEMSDEEYEAYQEHLERDREWQGLFHSKCARRK